MGHNKTLMSEPASDPIDEIRRVIDAALANECFGATVILIFAGIDAMGNVDRPDSPDFGTAEDFKEWVRRYFHLSGETTVTADEWWAARNAIVHTFGVYARAHKTPGERVLGSLADASPRVMYNPRVDKDLVLVDVLAMREAFLAGMESFLTAARSDRERWPTIERRIGELVVTKRVDLSGA